MTLKAPEGISGFDIADMLRKHSIECEYADKYFTVLMLTPENDAADLDKLVFAMGECPRKCIERHSFSMPRARAVMQISDALFSPQQMICTDDSIGHICGAPTVSCPPAIPIVVTGEEITVEAAALAKACGINKISEKE